MGVTIQQWRCAIARPAPALRSVKVTPNHEEMLSSMRDDSFKMWAFVGTIVMWLMLINFMKANSFSESRESSERNAENLPFLTEIRVHSTVTLQITLTKSFMAVQLRSLSSETTLPATVIKILLILGNVEVNPGPEMQPKLNLYRLLRKVEKSGEPIEFLREHNLLPRSMDCEHCCRTMTKLYPASNAEARFKYFRCKCENRKRIPLTKDTFFYHANITPTVFLVLAYVFCYRSSIFKDY